MKEYINIWKNFANFEGKTSLRGFWMAVLINALISIPIGILAETLALFTVVSILYSLATLVPGWAITVRRLHDAGYRWTYILMGFIPLVGPIILIIFLCKPTASSKEDAAVA